MKPKNNRCLVEPIIQEYEGKIIIPDAYKNKDTETAGYGIIKELPDRYLSLTGAELPMPVVKDQGIIFNKTRALPCDDGENHYLFVNIRDIMATF